MNRKLNFVTAAGLVQTDFIPTYSKMLRWLLQEDQSSQFMGNEVRIKQAADTGPVPSRWETADNLPFKGARAGSCRPPLIRLEKSFVWPCVVVFLWDTWKNEMMVAKQLFNNSWICCEIDFSSVLETKIKTCLWLRRENIHSLLTWIVSSVYDSSEHQSFVMSQRAQIPHWQLSQISVG